jgi:HD superfamily phosphodiesterase
MKTYKVLFDKLKNKGVYGISLVHDPAMQGEFIALSKEDNKIKLAELDKEQRILIGLVLEPDKPIYRNQGGEEFNIIFDADTIKDLSHNFFMSNSHKNSTIEHEEKELSGVTFVESWIIEDEKNDKSNALGLSYPKGSWMATMKVDNEDVWNNYVKTGEVQGFSIDAMVNLEEINLKSEIKMSKDLDKTFFDSMVDRIVLALTPKKEDDTKVELGSVNSADGSVVIQYDGEQLVAGIPVFVLDEAGEKVPIPDGEIELEGGLILVVADGIAMEIKEAVVEEELNEEAKQPSDADTLSAIENAIKSIMIKYSEITDLKIKDLKKENLALKEDILELQKQPAAKKISASAVQVDLSKMTEWEKRKHFRNNG